jgi:hypothetical protein
MTPRKQAALAALLAAGLGLCLASCSVNKSDTTGPVTPVTIPASSMEYVVFAWSDLGMHQMNATYDSFVIAPPYNTLRAQVIRRGDPPQVVTSGIRVEYSCVNNTASYAKRTYGQFWDNCNLLFGVDLTPDTGLNFEDPDVHNGLSGLMVLKGNYYQAVGIPLTPVDDSDAWSPYQTAEVVVRDETTGAELVRTRAVAGVSDEMNCAKCHGQGDVKSVLEEHDYFESTELAANPPVLCAQCHGDPALGQTGPGSSGYYLAEAVHGYHSRNSNSSSAACTDCHPGANTTFNRSTDHTASDGNCRTCHGTMDTLASTVTSGARVPRVNEPKCVDCHTFVDGVSTSFGLYATGASHGGLNCGACHGTPHATVPTSQSADHYQAQQYQNKAVVIGSCRVCHVSSKGGGLNKFTTAHGSGEKTACYVCHTAPPPSNNPSHWPHKFQQRPRN